MRVELPVLANVLAHGVENDTLQEDARLRRLHVGDEYPRCSTSRLRRPVLRPREREDTRPCWERGNDLEGFGERAGLVFALL